jgi:hypothetical protein
MPGFPMTVGSTLSCFHQAPAPLAPTQQAVLVAGQPVVTATAQIGVIGCLFNVGGVAQPCATIRWPSVSTKVLVQGQALLLMPPPGTGPSPGICLGPAPQGAAIMKANQVQVTAL